MTETDPLDAILSAPPCTASEAEANARRIRARNERVERNLPLVMYYAGRLAGRGVETGDLVQVGAIALIGAVEKHDPSRGALGMFAGLCIRSAMRGAIARARDEGSGTGGLDEVGMDLPDPRAVGPLEALCEADLVRGAVSRLAGGQRAVVELRHGLDGGGSRTQSEVADLLGVTRQRVGQVEGQALGKLRALLGA